MEKDGDQIINCSVSKCKYYKNGDKCSLHSIKVVHGENVEQESMCGSFENGDE